MSWISSLLQTYDNSSQLQGSWEEIRQVGDVPLLLIGQSTQNAQIEVLLDANADIIAIYPITDKPSQVTVIPCTEASIGRVGSKIAPHSLHDKLQYVAGDYASFGGEKASGFDAYMDNINAWCVSPYAHPKVKVIRDYLARRRLIADLVSYGILPAENGRLVEKADQEMKERYPLLRVSGFNPLEAFVRFRVDLSDATPDEPWKDPSVTESFNAWQDALDREKGLCYATGKRLILSRNHPAKLRHTGDKAKLISANDTSGFTYRGRFRDGAQAVGVAYKTTQKAHNMLKWLISRFGYRNDTQVFVAWGTRMQQLPGLADDTDELCGMLDEEPEQEEVRDVQNLRQEYSGRFRRAMSGYKGKITDADGVVVMGVDSATTGRLSIIFYRELAGTDFLERIESWHTQCSWLHDYKFVNKKRKPFIGAPAPRDIALAAYGSQAADKLVKATVETLLHCIVDGKPIPQGLRQSLVRRAGNPVSMERWEWQKTMSIACAVVRRRMIQRKGGEWPIMVDENIADRNYLFGRLLAYAQHIENRSQYLTEKSQRQTNAERMMHQFTLRPARTWGMLTLRLQSYLRQMRNPGLVDWWRQQTNEIVSRLGVEGFTNQPLDEQYILGYSSQMMALRQKRKSDKNEEDLENGTKEQG